MLPELAEFVKQIFPSIDPYTAEQARKALEQFEGDNNVLVRNSLSFDCVQGDIFSEIPFVYIDDSGSEKTIICEAQLISNSCDAENNDTLLFAAVRSLNDFPDNSFVSSIKNNRVFHALYFPDRLTKDKYVDFQLITTFSRTAFRNLVDENLVHRMFTLTLTGYYMFICKLTVFLMRPESEEISR